MRKLIFIFILFTCLKLQAQNQDSLNLIYQKNYELLANPRSDLTFTLGTGCGYGGNFPNGWNEINFLYDHKQYGLIKSILKSANPEGRLYAVMFLFAAWQDSSITLLPEDKKLIEDIISSPVLINACNGCDGYNITAKEIFDGYMKNH